MQKGVSMYKDLGGKTALITGAGKRTGIGYAVARKLAGCNVDIVIADLGRNGLGKNPFKTGISSEMKRLAAELADEFSVRALYIELDVTRRSSINKMVDDIKAEFSNLDILCNNAGTVFGVPNAVHTYDDDDWLKTIDVNLHGVFRVSKAIVPLMMEKGGSIVNMASRAAKVPPLFNGAYAVAKAGVIMLTKVMAKELAGDGIRVNALCPGVIRTDFTQWRFELEARILNSSVETRQAEMLKTIPMGRLGETEEVANLTAFLASSESSYITGQAINVTGGQLMEL
jgi:NAD(P)-dependent dehydrogenase (short-subunit alcohol dehydrogenase family)